jgi:ABC-type multidrug transport system fused ATPase/permease subunit
LRGIIQLFNQDAKTSFQSLRKITISRFHEIALGLFIVFYSYLSITGNLNIGFRHLFPIMPFIYILTSKAIIDSYKNLRNPKRKKIIRSIFIMLILALVTTVFLAYPYYTSYFNILFGGPKNGYHYVTDSNADWGQDLKRLKIWLNNHPEVQKINIDYFGGDNVENRIGKNNYEPWWDSKRPVEPGFYAISTLLLQESTHDTTKHYDDSYQWTQDLTPYAQVGTSIIIYKVD